MDEHERECLELVKKSLQRFADDCAHHADAFDMEEELPEWLRDIFNEIAYRREALRRVRDGK